MAQGGSTKGGRGVGIITRISVLSGAFESPDRHRHQYSCECERVQDLPEVDTQWVKAQASRFSCPLTPLSRSIFRVRASLPAAACVEPKLAICAISSETEQRKPDRQLLSVPVRYMLRSVVRVENGNSG
jgi:hypothetical protein